MSAKRRARAFIVTSFLGAAGAVACGGSSNSNSVSCGPGTTQVGQECAVVDAGSSEDARDSASSHNDATLTSDGEAGADATSDSAALDGAGQDDPCPTQAGNFINCSNTCTQVGSCASVSCGATTGFELTSWQQLPFTIRTPSHPGLDTACPQDCGVAQNYSIKVITNLPNMTGAPSIMLTVDPPWYVSSWFGALGDPICPTTPSSCAVFSYTGAVYGVWTSDPNAPARNAVFSTTMQAACP